MSLLPCNSTLSYGAPGGLVSILTFRSKISAVPVFDPANRRIKWVDQTLDVHGWVAGDPSFQDDGTDLARNTTGLTLTGMRQVLTKPGLILRFHNSGYGSFTVNDPAATPPAFDAAFGPHPKILSWVPIGDDQAAMLDWSVTAHIPECGQARYRGVPCAVTSEFDFDIDLHGWTTTRTVITIEIPAGIGVATARLDDDADAYRERFKPPVPVGFQRQPTHWHLSQDKRVLTGTFTDKQLPYPLPVGVTACKVTQDVGTSMKQGFAMYDCNLSGEYVPQASATMNTAKARCHAHFLALLAKKLLGTASINDTGKANAKAINELIRANFLGGAAATIVIPETDKRAFRLVEAIRISDDVYGIGCRFTAHYRILGANLPNIANFARLWQPLDDNFQLWKTSLDNVAWNVRGQAGIKYDRQKEVILDLCLDSASLRSAAPLGQQVILRSGPLPNLGGAGAGEPVPSIPAQALNPGGKVGGQGEGGEPDPGATWIHYQAALTADEDDHQVRHKPLADTVAVTPQGKQNSRYGGLLAEAGAGQVQADGPTEKASGNTPPDVIQQVSAPSYTIRLTGTAVRAYYRPPAPRIVSVNGVAVTQRRRRVSETVLGKSSVPIYGLAWDITYLVPSAPVGNYPVPENPMFGTKGGTAAAPKG